ncbi:MAG TPA: molybdopterin-guanine dinucleotide biosynthesis protein B [Syntrophaceticus sp.]|nr:molybdopterin-guanine dinucleotide biosynthesis protein B [Syntrophaceticus sp.]
MRKLIKVFKEKGFRVAAVKHAPHGYELDVEKRDTWQFCQAGADRVMVVGPKSLTMHHLYNQEPSFDEVCEMVEDVDLILVEGYKSEMGPKVEVVRKGIDDRPDLGDDLVAVVSDDQLQERVPCFSTESVEQLAEFLIDKLSLK